MPKVYWKKNILSIFPDKFIIYLFIFDFVKRKKMIIKMFKVYILTRKNIMKIYKKAKNRTHFFLIF